MTTALTIADHFKLAFIVASYKLELRLPIL